VVTPQAEEKFPSIYVIATSEVVTYVKNGEGECQALGRRPMRNAMAAASTRPCTPSFRRTLET
jgi:hypothetical protein